MTAYELRQSICHRVGPRLHRLMQQVAPKIFAEIAHRGITFGGRLLHGLRQNVVQIPFQRSPRDGRNLADTGGAGRIFG